MSDAPIHRAVTEPMALAVEKLAFSYGASPILDGFTLQLRPGEVVALLGPSGCGKTTVLKLVAGLLAPGRGEIRINGTVVASGATGLALPPERRGLGMVFQDYALWPHMSVDQNVGFPLKMTGVAESERRRRVDETLKSVGLSGYGPRRPADLSGGQQQRVAVARAIVGRPSLVLFDEPMSNLDRELRSALAEEIADLMRREGLSGLYVTHDQAEAFALADRVVIMKSGAILQDGPPQQVVRRPASAEVAEFMALGSILPARRDAVGWHLAQAPLLLCPADGGPPGKSEARVLLRPEAIRVDPASPRPVGSVCRTTFTGAGYKLRIQVGQGPQAIKLSVLTAESLALGTKVGISTLPEHLTWFD